MPNRNNRVLAEAAAVRLATCREKPALTPDDGVLCAALERAGAEVLAEPWDDIDPDTASSVCLRSTWDYHRRWGAFRTWVERFAARPGVLWNPPASILWNADKQYLRELAEAGVALPPTRWHEPGERPDAERFLRDTGARGAVLKPRVSATAHGTYLIERGRTLSDAEWAPLLASGSLLQSYVSEIEEGEASLVFVDGAFTHGVWKRPAPGEFRVQRDFGGRVEPFAAPAALRAFAERTLAAVTQPWIYARVDVVETREGPVLMELELIEPDLFLAAEPEAAERLAAALLRRGGRSTATA